MLRISTASDFAARRRPSRGFDAQLATGSTDWPKISWLAGTSASPPGQAATTASPRSPVLFGPLKYLRERQTVGVQPEDAHADFLAASAASAGRA